MGKYAQPSRRRFATIPSVLFFVYGLPGNIDDWQKWVELKDWAVVMSSNWQWTNILLILLGVVTFLYAVVPQRALSWLGSYFGTVKVPQPPKSYTERTVGELLSTVGGLTSMEADRFASRHIGKWIRVQSVISNISCDELFFHVLLGRKLEPLALLQFSKEACPSIETMRRGDRLAAEGRVTAIDPFMVYMDHCERVDLRDTDDARQRP